MKTIGYAIGALILGLFFLGAGVGQDAHKNEERHLCGGRPSATVNNVAIPCVDVKMPAMSFGEDAASRYQNELNDQALITWTINQKSIAAAKLLAEKNRYDPKELAKVVREMKKAVNDLCGRVRCEAKEK